MDDQERYGRFLSALGFRASVESTPAQGVDLLDLDGEFVEPAVRLHVCARTLAEHVSDDDALAPGARASQAEAPDDASWTISTTPRPPASRPWSPRSRRPSSSDGPGRTTSSLSTVKCGVDGEVRAVSADQVSA